MKFCKPKPKSILSLDIGTKRIGLAYCDPLFITSNILPAAKRFKNNQEIKIIRNYINEFNLTGFIVGIPLDEEGKICLLYTSPSPRDRTRSRMPSSA